MPRIGIRGTGVTGLVIARELAQAGHRVEVFERWPDVGGMASAFDLGNGVWLERYYHHLFESDSAMIALHEELTPGELEWHTSTVGMFTDGRVWPFTGPADLLRFSPLPPQDRIRLGLAVLRLQRRKDFAVRGLAGVDPLGRCFLLLIVPLVIAASIAASRRRARVVGLGVAILVALAPLMYVVAVTRGRESASAIVPLLIFLLILGAAVGAPPRSGSMGAQVRI